MVGRVGTEPMAGVSITNQLLTVFNLCVFGGMSGAGLFAAQYAGADDLGGVRSCFRFKLYLSVLLTVLGVAVFAIAGEPLISLYFNNGQGSARAAETLGHGMDYLLSLIHIYRMRHSATAWLSERRDVVIVASFSCIYGLGLSLIHI